jgi:hypothetical protein
MDNFDLVKNQMKKVKQSLDDEVSRLKTLSIDERKVSVETYREIIVGTVIGAFGNLFLFPSFINALTVVVVLYVCRLGLLRLESIMKG